ncbi:hypothetical protein ACQJBY_063867 [Aegilops geniculata]
MCWGRRRSLSDYVIHNDFPNSAAYDDSDIHEQHEVFGDVNTDLITPTVDNGTIAEFGQFDTLNENSAEHGDGSMGEQLLQSPAAVSTSGQDGIPEESNSDSVLVGVQNSVVNHEGSRSVNQQKEMDYSDHAIEGHCTEQIQCSSSEENQAMPTSEDNLTLHGDGSPDMNVRSNYYVSPESIGDAISAENCKKNTLLSNVALKSEMLEEVELSEAETKHVVSEASQAGNDILVKAAKLKKCLHLEQKRTTSCRSY